MQNMAFVWYTNLYEGCSHNVFKHIIMHPTLQIMACPNKVTPDNSCCVIGSTQLAVNCSLILLRKGFEIKQIYSNDEIFCNWADELSISHYDIEVMKKSKLTSSEAEFDYLFSIVNDTLVPTCILKNVKKLAINYHNGSLPRYAGTNSVNWAIINGETTYGISWHVMTEEFDSGVVLAREEFVIEDNDSLFNVNWKCMQSAERSLENLCQALNKGVYIQHARTSLMYFELERKPTPFCLLPLNSEAKEIYNFFRGCFHLRSQPNGINELGLPKILLPNPYDKVLIVSEMNVYTERIYTGYETGSVVTVKESMIVAVGNNTCIEIKDLLELDGTSIGKPYSSQFPSLCNENLMISECQSEDTYLWYVSKVTGRNDRRWSKRMSKIKKEIESKGAIMLTWPYYSTFTPTVVAELNPISISLCTVPNRVVQTLHNYFPNRNIDVVCLASFATFLLALSPSSPGYCDILINNNLPQHYRKFLLNFSPVLLDYSKETSLFKLIEMNCKRLLQATCLESANDQEKQKFWISSDIYFRYPIEHLRTSITFALTSDINHLDTLSRKLIINCVQQEAVVLTAQYLKDDFHPSSFSTVEEDFLCFLNACFEKPSSCVGSFPVCSGSAQQLLLNCRTLSGPVCKVNGSTMHGPFLKLAKQFPHKIAVVDEYGQYTYGDLRRRAVEIASVIGQPHRVALLLERTWEFIASMMAVLMVGASFVPIEPDFPLEYIQYIVDDSKSEVVIVDKVSPKFLEVVCKNHVYLNLVTAQSSSDVLSNEGYHLSNDEAAVLYTSGTTGRPKGVLLTHLGLINVLESVMSLISLNNSEIPNDYVLHSSSSTFDSFFLETFPPLWIGGTIIFYPTNPLERSQNHYFLRYVNFLHTQPVKLSFFKPSSFISLNRLTFGGEAPTMNLLQPWLKVCGNSWNIYGPTETSVITTAAHITDRIHLGNCIQNAHLRVLTPSMQIAPLGVSGELHIGGVGVALGYSSPAQTEKSFWKDSVNSIAFYKTGDLVYLDRNQILHFIGRLPKDRQVKVGGVRIELSGIEHVIQQQEGVKFVRVTKEQQTDRNDILVAYVCPEYVDCKRIHSYLSKVLPLQSIPTLIIPVQEKEIKFSTSGKLQMKRMGYKSFVNAKKLHSISSEPEKTVLDLYQQCLGLVDDDIFGLDSNIIEFGGDSVTILHLVGELRSKLKWDVVPSDVVDYTPSQLISRYHQQSVPLKSREVSTADSGQRTGVISGSQQALLSMDHIALGPTYNIPYTFKISGDQISCTHLSFALSRALKLIASTVDGKTSSAYGEVIHVDLSAFPIEKSLRDAIRLSQQNALLPIDLKKVPYCCTLFFVGKGCYVLSLVIHHICFDYSSWSVLQRILEDSYKSSSTEDLPMLTSNIHHSNNSEHLKFWKEEMRDCNLTVRLPTAFNRIGARPFVGERLKFKLDIDDTKIKRFCHGNKIDPSVFFLSVYGLLVHWLSKESSFGIGVSISQRHTANLKKVVGFLTNTVICKFPKDVLVGRYFDLLQYIQSKRNTLFNPYI